MALVPKNLYGFGSSPLSIKNKANAMDEEFIGDKDVGLLGIYHVNENSTGYIASALYTTRIKNHLTLFLDTCIRDNTIGKVYKININDELIKVVPYTMNLFDNVVRTESSTAFKSFRFSIDYDYFDKINNVMFKANDVKARIGFVVTRGTESKNYYIEESLENINKKAYKLDYSVFTNQENTNNFTIVFNTMEIILPQDYDNKTYLLVIYDILLSLI